MAISVSITDARRIIRKIDTLAPLYWHTDNLEQQNALLNLQRTARKLERKLKNEHEHRTD